MVYSFVNLLSISLSDVRGNHECHTIISQPKSNLTARQNVLKDKRGDNNFNEERVMIQKGFLKEMGQLEGHREMMTDQKEGLKKNR